MRCGKCKAITDDINHVRACYGVEQAPPPVVKVPKPATTEVDMTEKQYNFIVNLLTQKGVIESELDDYFGFTVLDCYKDEASEVIEYLLSKPTINKPEPEPEPDVPAGRYALLVEDVWSFYKVDRPTKGRWQGYTFLSALASDEQHPIRSASVRLSVLGAIAQDPRAASVAYGRQIGSCGVCGRTLTDPDSIQKGIGPVCAAKFSRLRG